MSAAVESDVAVPELVAPKLDALSRERLQEMLDAGIEAGECMRVLKKGGLNLVGEMLKGQGTFYEFDHYPKGDVYDEETHAQYYYHAHRGIPGEHGHFHTFLRQTAIPKELSPVPYDGDTEWPTGSDAVCHFVAVSMDVYGHPIGLFATNRWVTDEVWYAADDLIGLLDSFVIDHACPSWPANRWLSAMFRLFRCDIEALLRHRDKLISAWREAHPGVDVFEDRELEITGQLRISVSKRVEELRSLLQ
ncbi:MAG: hypothetical protein R3174_02410 [Gammaproteobacteria bacterium]|nr:hypothetical protein [Gammaproteobacteria bacterium]